MNEQVQFNEQYTPNLIYNKYLIYIFLYYCLSDFSSIKIYDKTNGNIPKRS